MSLADHVIRWAAGTQVVLFSRLTGRGVSLHPDTVAELDASRLPPPVLARLGRLHLIGPPPDLEALIPVRHRAVLLRPDLPALWAPIPSVHTHGGHGYRALPLGPEPLRIWQAINDARSIRQIAEHAGTSTPAVLSALARWTAPEVQAVQLRDAPPHPRDPSLIRLLGAPRDDHPRPSDQLGASGSTTLATYHLHDVTDGSTHFDDRETTVAHVCSEPHPALSGRRYGEALFDALQTAGLPVRGLTLEIGCGTGDLAAAWLSRGPSPDRYVRIDLSPELLRTQASRAPTPGVLADGTRLPFADGVADLVVSNEVMADLTAVPWAPGDPDTPEALAISRTLRRADLRPHPGRAWYNLGAWRLVEQVARVLRPGGAAVLTEFGTLDEAPAEAVQLDHPEVAIHFGHLTAVAEACGLAAEVIRLDALLGLDLRAPQLARVSWHALRAMARSQGVHLPARLYTPDRLQEALPWPVEGLTWTTCADEGPGPLVTRFYALLLRKR